MSNYKGIKPNKIYWARTRHSKRWNLIVCTSGAKPFMKIRVVSLISQQHPAVIRDSDIALIKEFGPEIKVPKK